MIFYMNDRKETGPVSRKRWPFFTQVKRPTRNVITIRINEDNNPGILLLRQDAVKKGFQGNTASGNHQGSHLKSIWRHRASAFHGQIGFIASVSGGSCTEGLTALTINSIE